MIHVVGAPFDLCGLRVGSRLGPAALRLSGLIGELRRQGHEVVDRGDIATDFLVPDESPHGPGLKYFDELHRAVMSLRNEVRIAVDRGAVPVVLGGEHSLAMAGVSATLAKHGPDLAVLWIDAHADCNTPGVSATGNLHGMPLAALWGLPSGTSGILDDQWRQLCQTVGSVRLPIENTFWYGVRDVDEGEQPYLRNARAATMQDIDRYGAWASLERILDGVAASGAQRLWISFDVDSFDPVLAPGTGTTVRGGLSYREGQLIAEAIAERLASPTFGLALAGIDLVEVNPMVDQGNETAQVAVEWLASVLGKTILGRASA